VISDDSIQKCKLSIKLEDLEVGMSSISQNDADTCEFAYRSICFSIIVRLLAETLSDKVSFLLPMNDIATRVIFEDIDPPNTNMFMTRRQGSLLQDLSLLEPIILTLHCGMPNIGIRMCNGITIGCRKRVCIENFRRFREYGEGGSGDEPSPAKTRRVSASRDAREENSVAASESRWDSEAKSSMANIVSSLLSMYFTFLFSSIPLLRSSLSLGLSSPDFFFLALLILLEQQL
jgi:hypothetical protein